MVIKTSGTLNMSEINAEWASVLGNNYNLGYYRGRHYYYGPSGDLGVYPSGQISFANFYGTALHNEWTGADCSGGGK
jgi:hypothetical protein